VLQLGQTQILMGNELAGCDWKSCPACYSGQKASTNGPRFSVFFLKFFTAMQGLLCTFKFFLNKL